MTEGQRMCKAPERLPSEYYVEQSDEVGLIGDGEDEYVIVTTA